MKKKYSVIITNAHVDDIADFDTLDEAIEEIERQKEMDKNDDLELLYGEKFIYAVRDNEADEIVYSNQF